MNPIDDATLLLKSGVDLKELIVVADQTYIVAICEPLAILVCFTISLYIHDDKQSAISRTLHETWGGVCKSLLCKG